MAKVLISKAGHPQGFAAQLNCLSKRYVASGEVCRPVGSMLDRIGSDIRIKAVIRPEFVRMLVNGPSTSFHFIGVASAWETQNSFTAITMTRDPKAGEGSFNWALWSNPELDKVARGVRMTFEP